MPKPQLTLDKQRQQLTNTCKRKLTLQKRSLNRAHTLATEDLSAKVKSLRSLNKTQTQIITQQKHVLEFQRSLLPNGENINLVQLLQYQLDGSQRHIARLENDNTTGHANADLVQLLRDQLAASQRQVNRLTKKATTND